MLVVFGGGDATKFGPLGGALISVASLSHLGLNNTGDSVTLRNGRGVVINTMTYGPEGGKGVSLVRQTDGDPNAPFVAHSGRAQSAGLRQDGTPF